MEGGGQPQQPSEEELRAALEAEMRRITVDDVLIQTVVSLINLGGRRTGTAPGTEDERDLEQVRKAIEAVRALLPLVPEQQPDELAPIRDALARLQMVYAKLSEEGASQAGQTPPPAGDQPGPGAEPPAGEAPPQESGPGPAQSSGRLWIPGQ
jgi:hypothetical protein